ncbi:MAG: hypothetical protein ACKO1U_02600 [Bacteroidota bacterium]
MKRLIFLALLLPSLAAFSQKQKAEAGFKAELDQRADSLDPIEGIWNVSSIQEFYRYDTLYDVARYPKAARVAVIKRDGKFRSYDMSGAAYEVEFSFTDVKGVYLYRNFFKETQEYSKAQAVISREGEMEYTYDFPDNYLRAHFLDTYEEGTRVTNQLQWVRSYPPSPKR